MKRKPKLTRVEKKKLYKTAERYYRIKKEHNRHKKAQELNEELSNTKTEGSPMPEEQNGLE